MRRRRFPILWVLLAIIVIVGGYFGHKAWQDYDRPMFWNTYGKNDRMLYRQWVFSPPLRDLAHNHVFYDDTLHLLVVVLPQPRGEFGQYIFWSDRWKARVLEDHDVQSPRQGWARREIDVVERTENRLIVIDAVARTRFEQSLSTEEYDSLIRAMKEPGVVDDFRPLLEKTLNEGGYPKGASPLGPPVPVF